MLTQEFIEEMKSRLLHEKERLSTELAGLKPHTELGSEDDDQASELALDEVNQDLIARLKTDLGKIEVALEKITLGTYGTDADGVEISEQRLRAIPWADKAI